MQALLDLRFKPDFAIQTAVDYGMQNLAALSKAGYQVDALDAADKAKVVYLCHHLGIGDAKRFIDDAMTEEHAKYLLEQQAGKSPAETMAKNNANSYLTAHRVWLSGYIDKQMEIKYFSCTESGIKSRPTLIIIEGLK